jgi:hypothetical protein
MYEEKTLNEGLENAPENQDNMEQISSLAFGTLIGCSPFLAKSKLGGFTCQL